MYALRQYCRSDSQQWRSYGLLRRQEKHVPVVKVDGSSVTVTVGSTLHPMEEKHYIQWVYIQTSLGGQRHSFKPGDKPETTFALTKGETFVAAYEYCNLHGLWKKL